MRARPLGFVPALDGLRGLAIIAVTSHHFFGLSGGFYGVDLFFVLSGFLITTLLLEELDSRGRISLRAFYVRRARRLLPALAVFLLAMAVAGSHLYAPEKMAGAIASAVFYCLNIVGVAGHPFLLASPLGHLWSLSQEEQFYLIWPVLLIAAAGRMRERRLAVVLLCAFIALVLYRAGLAMAGASWTRINYAPDTHADGLVLGCLVALLRRGGLRLPVGLGWPALAGFAVAVAIGGDTIRSSLYGLPPVEIASALLVLAAVQPTRIQTLLSWRPLVWTGALSYSLYIWQTGTHYWAGWLVTACAAPASYYFVERKFRLSRKVAVGRTASIHACRPSARRRRLTEA